MLAAAQTAGAALPSYFDGCAILTADDASSAAGAKLVVATDTLGPEGFEAASCQYRATSPKELSGVGFRAYTKASVEGAGGDFADDAAFQGDFPMDAATAVDVPGIGDRAKFGHPAGDAQTAATLGVLTVVRGDLRFVVDATGQFTDPSGLQQAATSLASRLLEKLAAAPPAPDTPPAPGSLKPPNADYLFGDGRSLPVQTRSGVANAVLDELKGPTTTGGGVFFNGFVPPELDLRNVALSTHGADRIAVLEFAAPLSLRTTWRDTPVSHRIEMIFRPPSGGPGVAVSIQPDGSGAVVNDPDGAATVQSPAPVVITGNWAALVVPAALGVGPDWTASAVVRIESATPMPGGSNLTGWVLVTAPVSVGSLTGEVSGSLTIGPPVVLNRSRNGASSATADLIARPKVVGPTITSTRLDAANGHRLVTITFDRPLVLPVGDGTITSDTYLVTIELAPPGNSGSSAPITIRWVVAGNGATAPDSAATVSGPNREILGRVPVTLGGAVVTLDLNALVPAAATPSPTTTTAPGSLAGARPTVILGGPTRRFRLNVSLSSDQCLCDGGAAAGFDPKGFQKDSVSVVVSGEAIALTRQSTGSTAVGAIDPATGRFQASNATEFWSGTIESGLDGVYAQILPSAAKGLTQSIALAQATGGGWSSILDPLNDAANQAVNGGGGGTASQSPTHPCGPLVTYQVYAGHGVYKTVTQPAPFYLPNPADGFDQNQYSSTYEFGRSLNGRWPPAGCGAGTASGLSANAGSSGETHAGSVAALPVATGAANFAAPSSTGSLERQTSLVRTVLDDNAEAQAALKLSDFGGDWTISVTASLSFAGGQAAFDEVQSSPAVRADRLSPVSAAQVPPPVTTTPATTTGATTPVTTQTPTTVPPTANDSTSPSQATPPDSTTSIPAGKGSDSGRSTAIVVIVVVLLLGATGGFIFWRRRRPPS